MGFSGKAGKNFYGRITVFHKSNSYSKKNRILDLKRILCSNGCLFGLEKKPSYTSYIGFLFYFTGIFSYIISPENLKIGKSYKGFCWQVNKKESFTIFLKNLVTGLWVHHIELRPGNGGVISRAAGTGSFVYSKFLDKIFLKMPSGKLIKLSEYCVGAYGLASNKQNKIKRKGKAGINRLLGIRPTVRGVAMNPVDHPHGGGEGKKSKPRVQKTPWGYRAKDKKTVKILKYVKVSS